MSHVKQKVMVTGLGALTATAHDVQGVYDAIINGQSGISTIEGFNLEGWEATLGAELKDFKPAAMLPDKKLIKVISRQDVMGIYAAVSAVKDSGMIDYRDSLANPTEFNDKTGVFAGSPGNKYVQQYDFLPLLSKSQDSMKLFAEKLFEEVHPMWLLRILPNNVLAYTGITYGFKGVNHNVTNHAVGGAQALIEAWRAIESGQADRAVVVAYDMGVEPQALFYYDKLGVISYDGLKPFDASHNGTILGEGAAAIVLESEASARARNAKCYAEFCYGKTTTEGAGLFSLEQEGASLARLINTTIRESGMDSHSLAMVVAHGNGNVRSDDTEAMALLQNPMTASAALTAFKWSYGHTLCASGVLDAVLAIKALNERIVPAINGLDKTAAAASELNVLKEHQTISADKSHALIINRGFGSMNAAMLVRACDA